ncbi:type II toxin-antitoxin system Phd/YefM family antitoxin [Hoeflea sp.]|uniref:type II toxin-antitoxin system Phd/YefM family antitoxin n=1 Tax=Hoeflea sp. TaxID=1940281 RepID=UPI003B521B63
MREFSTGDLNKQVGDVTDAATREPVLLTRHKKPRFVLMSFEHYERMKAGSGTRQAYRTAEMPVEHRAIFDEALRDLEDGTGYDDDA